jgi:hypothetical protein
LSSMEQAVFFAVEVKNSDRIRPEDLRESRRIPLYRGREQLLRDGVLVILAAEFLPALLPDTFPE